MHRSPIEGLRSALPYLRLYQGKTFVVKIGGEAFISRESTRRVLEQVAAFHRLGIKTVLVHGGGPQATELSSRLGLESIFVDGRRVTDAATLEAMILALKGKVSTQILLVCREIGLEAVGISGIDCGLIQAQHRLPKKSKEGKMIDYGLVGDIAHVDTGVLNALFLAGILPVVSPLSADANGTALNINADSVASAIAIAVGAAKLLLVTGAPGILRQPDDPGSLISHLDIATLVELEKSGSLEGGMLPKAACITSALEGGVSRVHLVSHDSPDGLLTEVFTNEGCGTLVVRQESELWPEEML